MVKYPQYDLDTNIFNGINGGDDIWDEGLAGQVLSQDYFDAVISIIGQIKVYLTSVFTAKPVKVWNGSAWVTKPVKVWNGSTWVTTNY